jgi:ECF transporter S component (folate family)
MRSTRSLYPHPFSAAYWKDAAGELKDTRMLVFAALMIAVRLALKLVSIPLAPGLRINTAFLANAVGAMVFGPVIAALCAIVTDVLGYLMHPDGVFFLPLMLTEIAGSVIFALFLYRAKITPVRVMLSRFCICFFVNVVLQTPIMIWYYSLYMNGAPYLLTIPGIVKNLFLFPIESLVLTLVLSALLPVTHRLGLTCGASGGQRLAFTRKQLALLAALFVIGSASVFGYLTYYYNTTSLSASYSSAQRVEENRRMLDILHAQSQDYDSGAIVTIVESAKKPFLGKEITYTAAVYAVKEGAEDRMEEFWSYSKSPAAKDQDLERLAAFTAVVDSQSGAVLSFQMEG